MTTSAEHQTETGKAILREKGINFSTFKKELSTVLLNTGILTEDEWVEYYNLYARNAGSTGFEIVTKWAIYFFQDYNKKEHRLWLKK